MQRVDIGGDQTAAESDYFKIFDAFVDVTKLTGMVIVAILTGSA